MNESVRSLLLSRAHTIRDAMERLNADTSRCHIVFIADDSGKILGCITDGDIRRALLRGETVSSPAGKAARDEFVWARKGSSGAELLTKMRKTGIRQIPILDRDGRLLDVRLLEEFAALSLSADFPVVIMAGGQGARLRPYTQTTPKPLLKIGDQTILERLLAGFRAKGVREFYITVNYLADQIMEHLGDGSRYDCKITYVRESKFLGTAGGLALLRGKLNRDFLVINGDVISTVDILMLENFHKEHQALATVCTKLHTVPVPYGVVKTRGSSIVAIEEKPDLTVTVNAGIYFFSPSVLDYVELDQHLDMTTLLEILVSKGLSVKCFQSTEPWIDVGSQGDFQKAEKNLEYLTL